MRDKRKVRLKDAVVDELDLEPRPVFDVELLGEGGDVIELLLTQSDRVDVAAHLFDEATTEGAPAAAEIENIVAGPSRGELRKEKERR